MPAPRTSQLPASVADRVVAMAAAQGLIDKPAPVKRKAGKAEVNPAHWQGIEKDAQRETREWLRRRGYLPRDKAHILGNKPDGWRGWAIHVNRAIGNPYLADWLLLDGGGRYLELELKTADGVVSPIQAALGVRVVRGLGEFWAAVTAWENAGRTCDAPKETL